MPLVPPGKLDARVLWQESHWVTIRAEVLELAQMSDEHLEAVVAMLGDSALALAVHIDAMVDALDALVQAAADGVVRADFITSELMGASIASVTPAEFLETTPLIRAIRRELARRRRPQA